MHISTPPEDTADATIDEADNLRWETRRRWGGRLHQPTTPKHARRTTWTKQTTTRSKTPTTTGVTLG
eukprot:8856645-Pyramimonas_sp.AAC.1